MKIIVYIAITPNGMISNARNVPDWLSPEYGQGLMSICQKTKAVIMGKTTYNILAPDNLPLRDEGTTIVLTTNNQSKPDNTTVIFMNDDAAEIVQSLTEKGHTEAVIIGGTQTISTFIKANLVDEIYLVVEPSFFGSGLPLFKDVELEAKLGLLDIEKLNANTIQLHYRIKK